MRPAALGLMVWLLVCCLSPLAVSSGAAAATSVYDLNEDGAVNFADITFWELHPVDLNGDGVCNIGDVSTIGLHFGETEAVPDGSEPLIISVSPSVIESAYTGYAGGYFTIYNENSYRNSYIISVVPSTEAKGVPVLYQSTPAEVREHIYLSALKAVIPGNSSASYYFHISGLFAGSCPEHWYFYIGVTCVEGGGANASVYIPVLVTMK
jgi:hypothetical protein